MISSGGNFLYGNPLIGERRMTVTEIRKEYIFILLFMLVTALIRPAAFSFQPLRADFSPSGRGSIQTFQIRNDSEEPIAVGISMMMRSMNLYGQEENQDASHLFAVFPRQAVLQPGAFQAVRVQWKGPSSIEQERAFRIIAEQLPVRFDQNNDPIGGSINIQLRYKGSVYVVPKNARPDLIVTRVGSQKDENGEEKLAIDVRNNGNSHVIMQDLEIQLNSINNNGMKESVMLGGKAVEGMNGENILAGSKRRFLLPWPPDTEDSNLDAELYFKPVR